MNISVESMSIINNIFDNAYENGRKTLYEHEVYMILKSIGLDVPKFVFVKNSDELTEKMLEKFGRDIVVKIVSSDISHKQKLGGVKVVKNHETLYVGYVLDKMRKEVLSHFEQEPNIEGFLIVEFIPHTQSIGYEVLIGSKDDSSFGPVITFTKGGDDAEFFAKYYDPANLFLPPFRYNKALELVNDLNICHKFKDIGHEEYLELMAKAASLISSFAFHYSNASKEKTKYIVKALDINPFVITKDNRFIAVDGFAQFEKVEDNKEVMKEANVRNIEPFFNPKGIAVIGVSANPDKHSMGREIAKLLHDLGREDIYFVNIKGGKTVIGDKEYQLYKSIDEIPVETELAVYVAKAKYVFSFFEEMKTNIPKSVVLIPGIPSDMKYEQFKENLSKVMPEDVRVIGPNCMGVFYGDDENNPGVNTLFIDEERLELNTCEDSNTVFLTQSGGMALTLIDKFSHLKIFKSVVSFGNKYDVKIVDLIKYFAPKEDISNIALYVEGFDQGEGRKFYELAKDIDKPIIIYKSGKTDAGAKAAASHTAAMTGDYDVFKAVCEQAGVILIDDIKTYYDCIKAFSLLADKKVKGRKVAGVVNAGFEATIAADELGNLELATLSEETNEKLKQLNYHGLIDTSSSIIDVTPMTEDVLYAKYIEAIIQDDAVDAMFVSIVPHANDLRALPNACYDDDSLANTLVRLVKKYNKPITVSVNAGKFYREFVSIMEEGKVAVYDDIRSSVKALDTFVSYNTGIKK
ncbi:acetate--CoA ligase family protein [Vallitalea guaymasensis]|uniref:Acetate--CoA ligase family protein n=1 Tax=Vallitalea guaymasensis TaxID=1185412 RepID=A0A8J8M7I9_9FIRM|nr:acetate--CoA ligase family protein [Vallitalea guaymasensis]QUH27605.1 acetate--CoA ligase family protein [Vallitalea guaymasensis]